MAGESRPRIVILDGATANQIAAGEVVERPASVVKELVENSLDAGARHIGVEVRGGGLELIRVRDDGWGINREDVPLAFARHATSKIRQASDLAGITTLGFRGEALPSIAAVARVEMDTRPAGETAGTRVRIAGGEKPEVTAAACPPGTTVTVTDLFYNTPVRRQYLRKPAAEGRVIAATVEKLALAHPEVAFSLTLDGRRLLATPGNGDLQAAVVALYGLETGRALLNVSGGGGGWQLQGFISPVWLHRAARSQQVLIVNGRYIYNRIFARVVEDCYHSVIPAGRHPIYILHLAIDPRRVDVNVHPAKLEVRFQQEYDLARQVAALINRSLHTARAITPVTSLRRAREAEVKEAPPARVQQDFNFREEGGQARAWGQYIIWEKVQEEGNTRYREVAGSEAVTALAGARQEGGALNLQSAEAAGLALPPLRAIGQLHYTYILAEGKDGLYIVDQHAAHERCRYERLQRQVEGGSWPAQLLEPPLTLHLAPSTSIKLVDQIATLGDLGFSLEPFGPTSFLLRSVPAGIPRGKEQEVLEDFLAGDKPGAGERLLKLVACIGAVKSGDPLSPAEMQKLLEEMQESRQPFTCPHGRPAVIRLDQATLARYFHRPPATPNHPSPRPSHPGRDSRG